ncbi:MAG TPA: ribosome-associated translation inhibitor RaiA [Acidothermaceae bacterium]
MADVVISGRHVEVPAQLRAHIDDKLAKVAKLAPKAMRVDVQISRERNPRLAEICDRVELTCVSAGPVIRAEAAAPEMTEAFDLAWAKLESRLRRAADRKRVHRGVRTPISVASATAGLSAVVPPELSAAEMVEPDDDARGDASDGLGHDGPMVVREKLHLASPMTLDQALYEMELVGHAFFLFADRDTGLPSVVYRRHAYDYGVIRIDTRAPSESAGQA